MLKLLLIPFMAYAVSQKQPEVNEGPWPIGSRPDGTSVYQCTSYPELGNPQDPNFNPGKHNWPSIGGIKQNQFGPYHPHNKCLLPDAGLSVGGGKYFYVTAGGSFPELEPGQKEQALEMRRNLSSSQKFLMLKIEASNSNWVYNLVSNGVRLHPLPVKLKCLLDRLTFKTSDQKHYYYNYYRYVGVDLRDKGYIPTLFLKDYKAPDEILAELSEVPGCLE